MTKFKKYMRKNYRSDTDGKSTEDSVLLQLYLEMIQLSLT